MNDSLAPLSSARWRRLIPIAFITYSFAYVDRSNYSIGAAGGLVDKLHITSGQSGLLGGLFFIGYFLFQVPAGSFAERRSIKSLMFWSLIAWGVLAALQGVVTTYWLLLVVRFLLGVVEAVVLPAMLVFLSHWFSKAERGRADTFLILGNPVTPLWMSVVSGYLVAALGYQWMFIIEGLPAVAWAFIFRALVRDRPRDADWLSAEERDAVEERLADEQRELPPPHGIREVMTSWNAIVLSVQYLFWSVGVYGLVFWLPSIVQQLTGRGIGSVGLLSAVPYAAAVVVMVVASAMSDRLHLRGGGVRVAVPAGRRRLLRWLLLRPRQLVRPVVRVADCGRGGDVCPLRAVLRDHPGVVPRGRRGPGDRHDQRGRWVGWICWHLHRRGPRRSGLGRPVGLPRGLPPRCGTVDVRGAPSAWRVGSRPSAAACPVTVRWGGACAGDRPAAPCLSPPGAAIVAAFHAAR